MKSALHSILLAAALTTTALAQQPADPASTRDDIQRLFTTMRVQEQMRATMETMIAQQREMIGQMLRKHNRRVSGEDIDEVADSAQEFLKNFPLDDLVENMIPVYQKHLTKTDVDAMVAFYSSPTGQKLLREQSGMAAESMQAVSIRVQAALKQAMDRAEQKAAEKAREEEEQSKPPSAAPPEQRKN